MSNWYYDKDDLKDTPSIHDGLDIETERRYRKEGARFIMECGVSMGLGHNTMATGIVFFHRFYMFRSFKLFPRYLTACSCLFLAGKVEETPKKCKDIIRTARTKLSDEKFMSFGLHPKEEVMILERILLQTIKFDLQVEHPYSFLVKYAKCLIGDQLKLQKMVQMAWNFANDSFSTTVCLQWEPETIAAALIHLSCKLSKLKISKWVGQQPEHLHWWDMFFADVTVDIFEDICHQVLDLYQQTNSSNAESPPQFPFGKSSHPPKRTEIPSTSPPVFNETMPNIDEKIGNMSIKPMPQSITTDNVNCAYPPAYGTMFKEPLTMPPQTINQTIKSYPVHVPQASSSNKEDPHQLSPSKSSPPLKRTKMSSRDKSSPVSNVTMPTIDEKLGSMSIRPIPQSIHVNYAYPPPAYGTSSCHMPMKQLTDFKMPPSLLNQTFKMPPPLLPQTMKSYSVPPLLLSIPIRPSASQVNQTMKSVYAPQHAPPPPLIPIRPRNHQPPNPFRQRRRRGCYFQRP